MDAPVLFKKLVQDPICYRAQVAHGEVGVIGGIVGERYIGGVKDFGPFRAETGSEGILQLLLRNTLGTCKPNPVEAADGNHPARDDSPGFIKIDRQAGRRTICNACCETGKNAPAHRSEYDKRRPCGYIQYPRQAAAAERH
ncbi:MAG: hypothetical protein JRF65_08425, partial [Deltaproteobacteria bacterium]|nr:hypothetical protein [Deltaproteobacteria bacterium]